MAPSVEYGNEVWAAGTNYDSVDTFHVKFLKRVLKLRPQTPTLAVFGELGEYPLSVKLELRTLKYFLRLMSLPQDHIAKKMLLSLKSLDSIGLTTWFTHVRKLIEKYDLEYLLENDSPSDYKDVKRLVQNSFQRHFFSSVLNSQVNPKLRTYKLFKKEFDFENYLGLTIPKYRFSLCRFRPVPTI